MFEIIFFVAISLVFLGLIYVGIRVHPVAKFRNNLIDQISDAAHQDIKNGLHNWMWRYNYFETVSFDRCVYSFKPLKAENFYSDTSFLKPTDVSGNNPDSDDQVY